PETRFVALAAALPAPPSHSSLPARDLFALNTEYFPHAAKPDPGAAEGAKSARGTDDESLRQSAAARDAESIRLKSTLIGERPVAVLDLSGIGGANDALVRVGDTVNGFKVVRIEAKRV